MRILGNAQGMRIMKPEKPPVLGGTITPFAWVMEWPRMVYIREDCCIWISTYIKAIGQPFSGMNSRAGLTSWN